MDIKRLLYFIIIGVGLGIILYNIVIQVSIEEHYIYVKYVLAPLGIDIAFLVYLFDMPKKTIKFFKAPIKYCLLIYGIWFLSMLPLELEEGLNQTYINYINPVIVPIFIFLYFIVISCTFFVFWLWITENLKKGLRPTLRDKEVENQTD